MSMVVLNETDNVVTYVDGKGSGAVVMADKVGGKLLPRRIANVGILTDAQRLADTSLLAFNGVQIRCSDTGVTWEVKAGAWGTPSVPTGEQLQALVSGGGNRVAPKEFNVFDLLPKASKVKLDLPTPYSAITPEVVHPSVLYVPGGIMGYKYWMAYTPYPGSNSDYENPCIACSHDGDTWVLPAGARNPLSDKPTGGYSSDTHLFASPDNSVMYIVFRDRIAAAPSANNIRLMESRDGRNWSAPVTIISGNYATQDYGSPSIFWDPVSSVWVMVSHNLVGGPVYPLQVTKSIGPDIYAGWGAPVTAAIPVSAGGRAWWHSSFDRMADGRIVGILQDGPAGSGGSGGGLYFGASFDGGATFFSKALNAANGHYRSCMSIRDSGTDVDIWVGLIGGGFYIHRQPWSAGAAIAQRDRALAVIAATASYPSSVLWFDTFNRANGAIGSPLVGAALSVSSGGFDIVSNRLSVPATANSRGMATLSAANYLFEFTVVNSTGQTWGIFRGVDSNNYLRVGSTQAAPYDLVLQNIAGAGVASTVNIGTLTAGDVITIACVSKQIVIYQNGVLVYQGLDTSGRELTGLSIGVQANTAGTTFDNLLAVAL